ncbi:MAG: hypothetical protein ACI9KE_005718 [Polyangiales bacterium]|jgi:uncharacterized protein YkwD
MQGHERLFAGACQNVAVLHLADISEEKNPTFLPIILDRSLLGKMAMSRSTVLVSIALSLLVTSASLAQGPGAPPITIAVGPAEEASADLATELPRDTSGEARMLRRINVLRRQASHPPLQRDAGLDAAAAAHSQDMAQHGELGHVSERTGTPADRVRAANVQAARIAQNVARQQSSNAALAAILDSESHRAQLLDEQFTHIGLAAVRGESGVYLTQVVAHIPPPPAEQLPPPSVAELQPSAPSVEIETPRPQLEGPGVPAPPAAAAGLNGPRPVPVPSIRVPAGHRGVAGYWLQQHGRWWYFPVPAGVSPGTVVQPDLRFRGPPPGTSQNAPAASPARRGRRAQPARPAQARPAQARPAQARPAWRSPRRIPQNDGTPQSPNNGQVQGQVYWY